MLVNQGQNSRANDQPIKRGNNSGRSESLLVEHMLDPVSFWFLFRILLCRYVFCPVIFACMSASATAFRIKTILSRSVFRKPQENKAFQNKWAMFNLFRGTLPHVSAFIFWLIVRKDPWMFPNVLGFLYCELNKQPWTRKAYLRLLRFHLRSLLRSRFEEASSKVFFEKVLEKIESIESATPTIFQSGGERTLVCTTCRCEPDKKGQALLVASRGNKGGIVGLVNSGADPNVFDEHGLTPLYYAVKNNKPRDVAALLENGARIDVTDIRGYTPLALAAWNGRTNVVKVFTDHGADLDGSTDLPVVKPLSAAILGNHEGTMRVLLERGADPDGADLWGQTPLTIAASKGALSMVKALLEAGATLDHRDCFGETALFKASESGRVAVIQELLNRGADPTLSNGEGKKPIDVANERGTARILSEAIVCTRSTNTSAASL